MPQKKNTNFYNSLDYRKKQSIIAKRNWEKGIYYSLHKQEERQCINPWCKKIFEATPADSKKFCSRKCAAQINNLKRSNILSGVKEKIMKLYQKGLSMQEIADKTGWQYGKVVHRMKKFNIPRRSQSDALYVKWNPNGNPFKIKKNLNKEEYLLKGLGLGLYWGEGDKSENNTSVRLSNTDPYLIKKFKEFLIKICGVKRKKFFYALTLFNDIDEERAINFWTQHLRIKKSQLGKITKIPPQGKGTYKKKSQFGVFVIIVTNKKLKEEILRMIKEI